MSVRFDQNQRGDEESRRVQRELEEQLREFGDTMSDAFANGFDGKGEDIGDAAWDVGRAAVDMASYAIGQAADALSGNSERSKAREKLRKKQKKLYKKQAEFAHEQEKYRQKYAGESSAASDWAKSVFGVEDKNTPVADIRVSAQKRRAAGIALMIVGGVFAFTFGVSGMDALIMSANSFFFGWGLGATGWLLLAAAAGFGYMMWAGWQRIKAGRWLDRCADTVDGMDVSEGVSLGLLAEDPAQKPRKILKRVRKYIQKGWLTAWLDEQAGKIYLTAQDYRAAQQEKRAPEPKAAPAQEEQATGAQVNVETARRFAAVLGQERAVMRDEQAAEELEHMQKTTEAICDWLDAHPESLPKTRRYAEYYIPTTLKLLHTYNDVQGQKGENAEAIRRDIAGILHTLNQAYDNLYDQLLSDTALDVSSEIAALEGMLANDGLTGEGLR